jgi:hypothetical protein
LDVDPSIIPVTHEPSSENTEVLKSTFQNVIVQLLLRFSRQMSASGGEKVEEGSRGEK